MPTFTSDGDYSALIKTGAWRRHLPFLNLGNTGNYLLETIVTQEDVENFTPITINRQAVAADEVNDDAGGLDLYLIDESPLDPSQSARGIAQVSRLWAPEWSDITQYKRIGFALPDLRGLAYTGTTLTYTETNRRLTIACNTSPTTIDGDLDTGTFTYDDPDGGGTTAAIDVTSSAAVIESALTAVDTNVTLVTQKSYGIEIIRQYVTATENPAVAGDFDLTGVSDSPAVHIVNTVVGSNTQQNINIYRPTVSVAETGHAFVAGDIVAGATAGLNTAPITYVDANNYTFTFDAADGPFDIEEFYRIHFWYPRQKRVPARIVHQFYLPGVTAGITTAEDIPDVTLTDHDYALLAAIVDGTQDITIEESDLEQPYPGVYKRTLLKVYTRDLYDAT